MATNPNLAEFDVYAESYKQHVARALPPGLGEVDVYARIKANHLGAAISAVFPGRNDVSILDAGCGIGIMDSYLKQSYADITGFDISPKSIEFASEKNPELSYKHSNDGRFPFDAETFDVVFAACVAHHVPPDQWDAFFLRLRDVLKPGGLLVIYEHNPWNPITRWVVSRCEFDRDATLISSMSCRELAAAAGFKQGRVKNILFAPFEADAWCRWERAVLSWIPMGAQYEFSARK